MTDEIRQILQESIQVKQALLVYAGLIQQIADRKLPVCGNGGSVADAQHMVAELGGQFILKRQPFRAVAVTTNTSTLTALANDYGYETVFSRQVEALAESGDVLISISTSGNSPNVIRAIEAAKIRGAFTVGLTGQDGSKLKDAAHLCLCIPSYSTPRIQEAHITVIHILCKLIEEAWAER